jgi:hypothetical protein
MPNYQFESLIHLDQQLSEGYGNTSVYLPRAKNGFFIFAFQKAQSLNKGRTFGGEDFNTMERKNENKAIETNVKKDKDKIKSYGG